ncbi:GNAT family N-acetyltransferase [Bacillus sp. FJAT-22090]|uniref:GNAT family N-acetyltransferase n=1 Tax=Bacillus sp. FJAT-22090 TaxID=1581038 RepID=UPI0011A61FB0|nr:GNAT family N-acetyltransferase [Bacillus sp. FJAT-22090]
MKKAILYKETKRLIIRPFQKDDYEHWYKSFDDRLPSQYKYDDGHSDMSSSTKEWFVQWIEGFEKAADKDEMYILGVFRKEDGVNVGKVELITILRMDYQWAMMGYSIHNQFWKNGYGIESVNVAKQLFFHELHFHRIELHINTDNMPSINLAKRAGFAFECKRERFSLENDEWTDFLIYYQNNI